MRSFAMLASLIALVLGAGCGGTTMPEEPAQSAKITYTRTGGLAGINETLTVHADGSGTFEQRFADDASVDQFQLEPSRLSEIIDVLRGLDFESLGTGRSPDCADCLSYEISYDGRTLTADDVTAKPELREAISALDETIRTGSSP